MRFWSPGKRIVERVVDGYQVMNHREAIKVLVEVS
jgi:hypothetical protein